MYIGQFCPKTVSNLVNYFRSVFGDDSAAAAVVIHSVVRTT